MPCPRGAKSSSCYAATGEYNNGSGVMGQDETRTVLFYSYAVPGIDATYLKEGLTIAAETMTKFGGGRIKGLDVFVKRVR
jgi:hypothetical protein